MRVRFYQEIKDGRARIAVMESLLEATKNFVVVAGTYGEVFGQGLACLVKLELGEDVEGYALAFGVEEGEGASPVDEF